MTTERTVAPYGSWRSPIAVEEVVEQAILLSEPWLDGLRGLPEFTTILRKAHDLHLEAYKIFLAAGGETLLGLHSDAH